MNRNVREIRLRNLFTGPEVWGRGPGILVQRALVNKIGHDQVPEVIRLSLEGVRRMDVTFASEVIVEPLRRYLGIKSICVVHLATLDLAENIAAAAQRQQLPLMIWNDAVVQVVGLAPRAGNRDALAYVLKRQQVRAAELAEALNISVANASTKLKQLWETGFLMRDNRVGKSGGAEFVYRCIG